MLLYWATSDACTCRSAIVIIELIIMAFGRDKQIFPAVPLQSNEISHAVLPDSKGWAHYLVVNKVAKGGVLAAHELASC